MQIEMASQQKTTMKTSTRTTKKKWFTKIEDFLHVHDLVHIENGNKQRKKTTREIEGSGVTFDSNGNVASCEENFHIKEETEEY